MNNPISSFKQIFFQKARQRAFVIGCVALSILSTFAVVLIESAQIVFDINLLEITLTLILFISLVATIWWPRAATLIFLVFQIIAIASPAETPMKDFAFVGVCAILGYSFSTGLSLIVVVSFIAASAVLMLSSADSNYSFFQSMFVTIILCFIPWCVGLINRRRIEEKHDLQNNFRLQLLGVELKQKNRDSYLARRIHDSITNDLSFISMVIYQAESENPDNSETYRLIDSKVKEALYQTHEVIDVLDSGERAPVFGLSSARKEIDKEINRGDADLKALGIQGKSSVRGEFSSINGEVLKELLSLINELYANVMRHCRPEIDEYSLEVNEKPNTIKIVQSNTYGSILLARFHSGHGLQLHRQAIKEFNGTMRINRKSGLWKIEISIPE